MIIEKTIHGTEMTLALDGRLDVKTAPQLEAELKRSISGVTALIFDLQKLDYMSSAGIRVLVSAQKVMSRQGEMTIKNANEEITEVFEITGLFNFFHIAQ